VQIKRSPASRLLQCESSVGEAIGALSDEYDVSREQLEIDVGELLENSRSVAFLGNSGFGKSTLASSFHRNGVYLIDDDCILLNPCDD